MRNKSFIKRFLHGYVLLILVILFAFLFSFNFDTANAVTTPDPVRERIRQPSWCPTLYGPNSQYNLSKAQADSITVYCGVVFDADAERPMSGITVSLCELNPELPTGLWEGRCEGLYNSTYTDASGRWYLPGRKIGPGDNIIIPTFRCNDKTLDVGRVSSLYDIYEYDNMVYVPQGVNCQYTEPPVSQEIVNRQGQPLMPSVGESGAEGDLPIGSESSQEVHFNNTSGEGVHDIRHARFNIIGALKLGPFAIKDGIQSMGGMQQDDCLERYTKQEGMDPEDAMYFCNFDRYMENENWDDYITRQAFRFIPKTCEDTTERRYEYRGNLVRFNKDALGPAQTKMALFGDYNRPKDLNIPVLGTNHIGEAIRIDCDCLLAANSVEPGSDLEAKCPGVNNLLTGGPVAKYSSPYDFGLLSYSVESYELARDPNEVVCQKDGCKVTTGQMWECVSDPSSCPCGLDPIKARGYQRLEQSLNLANGESYNGFKSESFDSYPSIIRREDYFRLNDTARNTQENTGVYSSLVVGDVNGRSAGTNSGVFLISIATTQIVGPDPEDLTKTYMNGMMGPFSTRDDYFTKFTRNTSKVGSSMLAYHRSAIALSDGELNSEQQDGMELHNYSIMDADWYVPDGKGQSQNKVNHTAIYLSEKAIERDVILSENLFGILGEGREAFTNEYTGAPAEGGKFRNVMDSLMNVVSGDGNESMPFDWAGDAGLIFDYGDDLAAIADLIGSAWDTLVSKDDGIRKSFGHIRGTATVEERDPLLKVTYPLCEDNFRTDYFNDPYSPYKEPQWGKSDFYPWHDVEVCPGKPNNGKTIYNYGIETPEQICKCNTKNNVPVKSNSGNDYLISSTCRVEGCKTRSYEYTCKCDEFGNESNCSWDRPIRDCYEDDSMEDERLACAQNQTSCLDEKDNGNFSDDKYWNCAVPASSSFESEGDLMDAIEEAIKCNPNKCTQREDGSYKCPDASADQSDVGAGPIVACALGVADYNVGWGRLDIEAIDNIITQEAPYNPPTSDPGADMSKYPYQYSTDPIADYATIYNMTLMSPSQQRINGICVGYADWENTNDFVPAHFLGWGGDHYIPECAPTSVAQLKYRVRSPTLSWSLSGAQVSIPKPLETTVVYHMDPKYKIRNFDEINIQVLPESRSAMPKDGGVGPWDAGLQTVPEAVDDNSQINRIFGKYQWALNDENLKNAPKNSAYAAGPMGIEDPEYNPPPLQSFGQCDVHFCDVESVPWMSNTALNVINSAANTFNVPAAVMLAYMATEGEAFNRPFYVPDKNINMYADDLLVDTWSKEYYDRIQTEREYNLCSDLPWTEQGLAQWIKKYWDNALEPDANPAPTGVNVCEALNNLSDRRCDSASRCNFLDVMYVLAYALSDNAYPTCGDWDQGAVAKAAGAISGGAYNEGQIGNIWNIYTQCGTNNRPPYPPLP